MPLCHSARTPGPATLHVRVSDWEEVKSLRGLRGFEFKLRSRGFEILGFWGLGFSNLSLALAVSGPGPGYSGYRMFGTRVYGQIGSWWFTVWGLWDWTFSLQSLGFRVDDALSFFGFSFGV